MREVGLENIDRRSLSDTELIKLQNMAYEYAVFDSKVLGYSHIYQKLAAIKQEILDA